MPQQVCSQGAGNTQAAFQNKNTDKQDPPVAAARNIASASDGSEPEVTPATTDPAYITGQENVPDINGWKEPEMTRLVSVRPDGKISLPLINDVQAAVSKPLQLASEVKDKMRKFLTESQVAMIVTAINSQRVFVVGKVLQAGALPLIPGMTVLQAHATAGRFATFAYVKMIDVIRMVNGKHTELPFNYCEVL